MNHEISPQNDRQLETISPDLSQEIVQDMEARAAAEGLTLVELLKRALATQKPQE